ncbi:MAG TPA: HPr kinase/phosphatase C-terminal domain-containing protein [Sphingomicrobium sp.]
MNQETPVAAPRLSAETVHATTVAKGGRAVVLTGPSGSGKSDLALCLLDRGFTLVSDDQTLFRKRGNQLVATAPANIAGKLEVRGLGIVEVERVSYVPVALAVELTCEIERLPDGSRERRILGVSVPLIGLDAMTASAPSKVALALDRLGLKF